MRMKRPSPSRCSITYPLKHTETPTGEKDRKRNPRQVGECTDRTSDPALRTGSIMHEAGGISQDIEGEQITGGQRHREQYG